MRNELPTRSKRIIAATGTVDTGKTTITDRVMSRDPNQPNFGSIEAGNTRTDISPVERSRGITTTTVPTRGRYTAAGLDYQLTIVDTPGHADFRYQVLTGLDGVEGVLFLVDMNEGLTSASAGLLDMVRAPGIPLVVALNKADLVPEGEYRGRVDEIQTSFLEHGVQLSLMQQPVYENGVLHGVEDCLLPRRVGAESQFNFLDPEMLQTVLLNGEVPAVLTSGKADIGCSELLSYVFAHVPPPGDRLLDGATQPLASSGTGRSFDPQVDFSARVLNRIPKKGAAESSATVRIVSGGLAIGDRVTNAQTNESPYRITHMYDVNGDPLRKATAGDIVLLEGIDKTECASGHTLHGREPIVFEEHSISKPVIGTEVVSSRRDRLGKTMQSLARWDPSYRFEPSANGVLVSASSKFHLQVLVETLQLEFGLDVESMPFIPRYVAGPGRGGVTVVGNAASSSEHYTVLIGMNMEQNSDETTRTIGSSNTYGRDGNIRGLEHDMQRIVAGTRWFDTFPVEGLHLELLEERGSSQKVSKAVRTAAMRDAVEKLLNESRSIALFEPYVDLDVVVRNNVQGANLQRLLRQIDVRAQYISPTHATAQLPLGKYLHNEAGILTHLRGMRWGISSRDEYRMVPYEEAREIIRVVQSPSDDVCAQAEKQHHDPRMRECSFERTAGEIVHTGGLPRYQQTLRVVMRNFPLKTVDHSNWAGGPL